LIVDRGHWARRWRRWSLRSRLSLISALAVGVAVVAVSTSAWLLVREELYRQLDGQLATDAVTIAAQPTQWRPPVASVVPRPFGRDDRTHGGRDIGPRWQILDAAGNPVGTVILPLTGNARRVAAGSLSRGLDTVDFQSETLRMYTAPIAGGGAVQVALPREPVDRTLARIGILLALGGLAGIAGAALLGRRVAMAGLAPVARLTFAVEHVTATKDLRAAIPVDGEDEIARLARSFNAMLDALRESRAAQRTLVEDAGHELRTPLTSLRTNIELLVLADTAAGSGRTLSEVDRARLLRDLEVQVVELSTLANVLVELAQEGGSPEVVEPVDLADVVSSAVQRSRARTSAVQVELALAPAWVMGQPAALERMALNLLDNAIKWSPAGATVRVDVSHGGSPAQVRLTVADQGPGIDAADLPRIFERFYRADAARSMPGSGLGLAIVAQVVAQHGGTVTAGSGPDGGTVMTVTLPSRDAQTLAFS
jgi:two-component system sensor histidine kinase MprB